MRRRIFLATLATFSVSETALAEVYKCEVDGKIVFSQTRCGEDAQAISVNVAKPSVDQQQETAKRMADIQAAQSQAQQQRGHEFEVRDAEKQIRRLEIERDSELAAIERQRSFATNNIAGAVWEQSLATDKRTIIEKYNPQIEAAHRDLQRLREKSQ